MADEIAIFEEKSIKIIFKYAMISADGVQSERKWPDFSSGDAPLRSESQRQTHTGSSILFSIFSFEFKGNLQFSRISIK